MGVYFDIWELSVRIHNNNKNILYFFSQYDIQIDLVYPIQFCIVKVGLVSTNLKVNVSVLFYETSNYFSNNKIEFVALENLVSHDRELFHF